MSCTPVVFPVPDEIRVVRTKKEKVLRPSEFLVGPMELTGAVVTFKLEAKPTGSLRPDILLRHCVDGYNDAAAGGQTDGFAWVDNAVEPEAELARAAAVGELPCCDDALLRVVNITRIAQEAAAAER